MSRGSSPGLLPFALWGRAMCEVGQAEVAARINAGFPGWVVIWACYRRCFTAFGACTPQRVIIDDPDPRALVDRMRAVQLAVLAGTRLSGGP